MRKQTLTFVYGAVIEIVAAFDACPICSRFYEFNVVVVSAKKKTTFEHSYI